MASGTSARGYVARNVYGFGDFGNGWRNRMTERHCRYCSGKVNTLKSGRPPDYCSVGCRRAAEYEVRRASRRLERLEDERDRLERQTAEYTLQDAAVTDWQRQRHRADARMVAEQVDRMRRRMRDLLDDDIGPAAPPLSGDSA
jgi:hypothetical protein